MIMPDCPDRLEGGICPHMKGHWDETCEMALCNKNCVRGYKHTILTQPKVSQEPKQSDNNTALEDY